MKSGPSGSEPRTKQGNGAPKRESSLRSVSVMAELSVVFRTLKGGGGAGGSFAVENRQSRLSVPGQLGMSSSEWLLCAHKVYKSNNWP